MTNIAYQPKWFRLTGCWMAVPFLEDGEVAYRYECGPRRQTEDEARLDAIELEARLTDLQQ